MSSTSKQTVILAACAAGAFLLLRAKSELKNTIAGLTFSVGPGGWPKLIGLTDIEIPIKVKVSNQGFTDLPLQGINFQLERILPNGSTYAFAATPPQGVTTPPIKARSTTELIIPVRTGTLEGIGELWTAFQKRGMNRFRATGTVQAAGLSLPIAPVTFNL